MDPWIFELILAALAFTAAASSSAVRSILRTIFRRPRATTVIVEVDGKRLEFTGTQAAQDFIDRWFTESESESESDSRAARPKGGSVKRQAPPRTRERSDYWSRRYKRTKRGTERVTKRKDESEVVAGAR